MQTSSKLHSANQSLTIRAFLTSISSLLKQGAHLLVNFVVTPIIIRGLGAELYGAWLVIQQTVGYLGMSDLRPMGTLKFTLAISQHVRDDEAKRRQVGSALILWGITLPLFLILGAVTVIFAPQLVGIGPLYASTIQLTMAIVIGSTALSRVLNLPANMLTGSNLDYKAMGLNAATIVTGGLFMIIAIKLGWSLPGVALASLAGLLLTSIVRLQVARNQINWFGFARPSRTELRKFSTISAWLFLSGLSQLLLTSGDIWLVGVLLGPVDAAIYATTGAIMRYASTSIVSILNSALPGLAGLCGQEKWQAVQNVRRELYLAGILVTTTVGVGVILLNRSFLNLWVGSGYYVGHIGNLLLVVLTAIKVLERIDGPIIESAMAFRTKATLTTTVALLAFSTTWLVTRYINTLETVLAVYLGAHLSILIIYQRITAKHLHIPQSSHLRRIARVALVCGAIIFIAVSAQNTLASVKSWLLLGAIATAVGIVTFLTVWAFGLTRAERSSFYRRVTTITQSVSVPSLF